MNKVSSRKQDRDSAGRIFIALLALAIGLLIVAGTLAIVLTPTLSNKAMAAVTDTAPSSVYGVSPSIGPLTDSSFMKPLPSSFMAPLP